MKKLEQRKIEGARSNIWFTYAPSKTVTYSVVNLGELMKRSPTYENLKKLGMFLGWEAMILGKDGVEGDPIRAESWEELEKKLE